MAAVMSLLVLLLQFDHIGVFGIIATHMSSVTKINSSKYVGWRLKPTDPAKIVWFEAEWDCEAQFATTLATITNKEDLVDAQNVLLQLMTEDGAAYIGLYADVLNNQTKWEWIDGTFCENANKGAECSNHSWLQYQPVTLGEEYQIGTYLYVSRNSTDISLNETATMNISAALCNVPNDNDYPFQDCDNKLECWTPIACCFNQGVLKEDTRCIPRFSSICRKYFLPFAYWDEKIFIVTESWIHYTSFPALSHNSSNLETWNYFRYTNHSDKELDTWMVSQNYAQYRSSLYLYVIDDGISDQDEFIMHVNLSCLDDIKLYITPQRYGDYSCIVADADYVYVVGSNDIMIYNVNTSTWKISPKWSFYFDEKYVSYSRMVACALTLASEYIYIFHYYTLSAITRYNIQDNSFKTINTTNLCYFRNGNAVTAQNGKIYFHGCYIAPGKTALFNPNSEKFELQKVATYSRDGTDFWGLYDDAQLTVYDNNILLLMHSVFGYYVSMHYSVTNYISMDFSETTSTIWPSNGFKIKYNVNNLKNYTVTTYAIWFQSNHPVINASIILNTVQDNCLFHENVYKRYNCNQHFSLSSYLSLKDNHIDELRLVPTDYSKDTLFVPEFITITLERCHVSFENVNQIISNENPLIVFGFNLSPNCYSRPEAIFSMNITALIVNITNLLVIDIVQNTTTLCTICNVKNKCYTCSEDNVTLYPEISNLQSLSFQLLLRSTMMDLRVLSGNNTIQYFNNEAQVETQFDKRLFYLFFLLVIPICMMCLLYYCWRKHYNEAFIVDNAMVWIIGISTFQDDVLLSGVAQNVVDLKELWEAEYKYDVCVFNEKTLEGTKLDIIDFVDLNKQRLKEKAYKCVIVHVISHGNVGTFKSSDGKTVHIEFLLHELRSEFETECTQSMILLVFHHGCQGTANYSCEDAGSQRTISKLNAHAILNDNSIDLSYDSNYVIISGNVPGRSMSDSGLFSQCICDSFRANLARRIKADFTALVAEIGRNLERESHHAEILIVDDTLRFNPVRFEQTKNIQNEENANITYYGTMETSSNKQVTMHMSKLTHSHKSNKDKYTQFKDQ
eukprot:311747_1